MFNFLKVLFSTEKPVSEVESNVDLNIYFKYRFSKFYGISGADYYYGIIDYCANDSFRADGFMMSNPSKKISLEFINFGLGSRGVIAISREEFERKGGLIAIEGLQSSNQDTGVSHVN